MFKSLDRKSVRLREIKCDKKPNPRVVEMWKKSYREGSFVPSPVIDDEQNVIAFHDSYFAARELGLRKINVSVV